KNTYSAPAAAAMENQIRIVVDMGTDVTVKADPKGLATAGAGIFGIGFMFLPNPDGIKTFEGGSYSEGCGLGGVGGLFVKGQAHITGDRFVQGCGIFGVGLIDVDGKHSTYTATRTGQGVGLVRGVGIMSHTGDDSDIKGGLIEPDPREPKGAVSLCQGVGYG